MTQRVLVADDDQALQVLLNVLLTRAGFDVDFAHDGKEALTKMTNGDGNGHPPYAVFMLDLILPEMSGIEILAHLQRDNPELLRRVIVVTSASRGIIDKVDVSRIHALIQKPFDIQDFIRLTSACALQT
ncbi:MAG TPA: response regulator [Thermoanaerobaculia bacterium]|nr:response regulator [Thermoanaerobaculia bacterium]